MQRIEDEAGNRLQLRFLFNAGLVSSQQAGGLAIDDKIMSSSLRCGSSRPHAVVSRGNISLEHAYDGFADAGWVRDGQFPPAVLRSGSGESGSDRSNVQDENAVKDGEKIPNHCQA